MTEARSVFRAKALCFNHAFLGDDMQSPTNETKTRDYKTYLKRLLQTTAIVAVSGGHAFAQDADTPEVIQTPAAQTDTAKGKDVIVVTGSRIKKDGFSSEAPIDVLTMDDAMLEGISDIGSLLQTATVASGSPQVTAATSNQFVQAGGLGSASVSLRGLGANRTLSLVNGRRAGPSGVQGQVSNFDLNTLPTIALERVEILKDGASSIYGTDAVAGVVNYITRKDDYKGIDFFASQPEQSGGEQIRASGTWGKTFDRGRLRITGDYYKRKEMARGDRDYYDCAPNYVFNADGSGNRADVIDPRTGDPQCIDLLWGHVWVYDYGSGNVPGTNPPRPEDGLANLLVQYDYDGTLAGAGLSPYPNQGGNGGNNISVPNGFFPIFYSQNNISYLPDWNGINVGTEARGLTNGDHPFQDKQSLIPEQERITLMAEGELEMGNGITAYGEALYNRRVTKSNGYRQFWSYVFGETGAVFGGGANTNPTAAGWSGNEQWYSPTAITDHSDSKVEIDYFRFVGGMTGDLGLFGDSWSWDAHMQYSDNKGAYTDDQIRNDSIRDNNFTLSSCVGSFSSVAGLPCVDVPWFDPQLLAGNISQEVQDFLFTTETGNTSYTQLTAEAYVAGNLVELPAGWVGLAVGAQIRRDQILDTPSDIILAGNAWLTSASGITGGKTRTTDFYGEIDIPVVKDKPFFESFDLKGSVRRTKTTATPTTNGTSVPKGDDVGAGSGTTYKIGANWQVVPQFRLRATHGTSFRTPALFELFLANQTSSRNTRGLDPCVRWGAALAAGNISQNTANNCATDGIPNNFTGGAITTTITRGGGIGVLESENSKNYTIGGVWSPEFADLQVSVDYFKIEVSDEVAVLGAGAILGGCYTSESFATEPLCDLIVRNPPGADAFRVTDIRDSFINVNSQVNEGFDFTARYGRDTRFGRLVVDGQATHQLSDDIQLLATSTVQSFNGESGEPKTTGFLRFNLDMEGPWQFLYRMDYIGKTSNRDRFNRLGGAETLYNVPVLFKLETEAVTYHTVSASREFGDSINVTAGVRNLFGEEPPNVSSGGTGNGQAGRVGATDFSSNYDVIGREFFFNVTKSFN